MTAKVFSLEAEFLAKQSKSNSLHQSVLIYFFMFAYRLTNERSLFSEFLLFLIFFWADEDQINL